MNNMARLAILTASICLAVPGHAQVPQDVQTHQACIYCGMKREMFDFSRMLVEYDDGTAVPTCSLHCVAIDLANKIDKAPKAILVGDFQTKQLIDAESATWVLEGSKAGVMTKRGKWAFATKAGAEAFLGTNGGRLGTFEQAVKMAYEDMYEDTMMIRARRKAKKMSTSQPATAHSPMPAPAHP